MCGGRGRGARRARHVRADAARRARLPARHLSGGAYIEGSVSFLRVRDARGTLVVDESGGPRLRWRVRRRLPAGRYRLTSFERPCDGNCSLLDPPTDRCSRPDQDHRPRPHRGARDRASRARLSPPGTRAPRPLSAARARAGGTPLPLSPRRDRLLGADRLAWAHARPRRAAHVHLGQPRQGDAARGVPAPRRQPRPDGGRAGPARPDDHALGQRARERRLRACGGRRPARARRQGRDAELLRQRLLVGRTSSARRTRRASSASSTCSCHSARAPTRAGCSRRSSPGSAGASPASRSRPASTPSSRAAGAARALAGSSTRRPSSSAGRCACRWPC